MPSKLSQNVYKQMKVERICTALLAGAFIDRPNLPLKRDIRLWSLVFPVFNTAQPQKPSARANLLDKLVEEFSSDELRFFGEELTTHLSSTSALYTRLERIALSIAEPNKVIVERSFLGSICKDVWHEFAVLDISETTKVWKLVVSAVDPLLTHLGVKDTQADSMATLLSKAIIPLDLQTHEVTKLKEEQSDESFANDLGKLNFQIHRDCDLSANSGSSFVRLAEMYASQGNVDAALEAVHEAFLRDRRTLIREVRIEKSNDPTNSLIESSARNNRELVGWLQNLLCIYERPKAGSLPPALDVPLSQLRQYSTSTAATNTEKLESLIQEVQSDLITGRGQVHPQVLKDVLTSTNLYSALFNIANTDLLEQFYLACAQIWSAYGFQVPGWSYRKLTVDTLNSPAVCCELALLDAFELDLPLQGLTILAHITQWNDTAQSTSTLLMAYSLVLAHDLDKAKMAIEQLEDCNLPRQQKKSACFVKILLSMYEGDFYAGFLQAKEAADQHAHDSAQYLALKFNVWAIRCLVCSQSHANAAQAQILLQNVLTQALSMQRLKLAFELVLLQARVLYNQSKFDECYKICHALHNMVDVTATTKLKCEWWALLAASTHALDDAELPQIEIDPSEFARCIYTEFNPSIAHILQQHYQIDVLSKPSSSPVQPALSPRIEAMWPSTPSSNDWEGIELAYREMAREPQNRIPTILHTSSPNHSNSSMAAFSGDEDHDSSLSRIHQKRTRSMNGSPQRRNSKRRSVKLSPTMKL